jgi:hypothetical protein
MMVATPFLLLALLGIRAARPWLLGLALTVLVWGYFLYSAAGSDHAGISVGLELAMVASPPAISLVCLIVALRSRKFPSSD